MGNNVRLSDVATIIMGQSPPSSTYNKSRIGLPFFQGISDFNYRYPTERIFCSSPTRVAIPGDILFSVRAPIGRVNIAQVESATGRGIAIIRAKNPNDSKYLEYFLRSIESYWDVLEGSGSVFGNATKSDLSSLYVPWPEMKEAREAIGCILGSLDDKIELNRQLCKTLEDTAQAIFKSWFVDFDPVHAKAAGKQPVGLKPEIAALFPDSFVDSELGKIPKGWIISRLGDHFHLTMGQSPPGNTYNEDGTGDPFYQGRSDFGFRFPRNRVYCTAPKRYAEKGDTLVSVRAPVGDINMAFEHCAIGRGVAAVRHIGGSSIFTYYSMKQLRNNFVSFEAEGSVFGSITKGDFLNLPFIAPSIALIESFDQSFAVLENSIESYELESITLTSIRDSLLPRLISGELKVKDAERIASRLI